MQKLEPYYKNIRKIFLFYSIQQSQIGKSPTFDQIYQNANTLTKGKFLKFCLDFQIPLSSEAFLHIFNKSCNFSKEMTYSQFTQALEHLMGKVPLKDFIRFLGIYSSKVCLSKCKPFSLSNGRSLPELPALVTVRKKVAFGGQRKEKAKKTTEPRARKDRVSRNNSGLAKRRENGGSALARRFSLFSRLDTEH